MVLSLPASMNYAPIHAQDSSAQVQDNSTASQNGTQPVIVPVPSQPLITVQGTTTRSFSNPSGLVDNGDKITQNISWYQNGTVALSDSAGNNFSIGIPVQQGNFTISQNDTTVDQKFSSANAQYDLYWKQIGIDGHTDKYKITIVGTSSNGFTMKMPVRTSQFLVQHANQFLAVQSLDNSSALAGGIGLDWSDAVAAGYNISLDSSNNITLNLGRSFSVDPTTIDTTTAKVSPPNTDYYEGEKRVLKIGITTFAFYYDNSNIVYQYSTDGGNSWSGKLSTGTGTVASDVYRWTVSTANISGANYVTLLYYHVSGSNTNFYGLRGTVTGTNISWNSPTQIYTLAGNTNPDAAAVAAANTNNTIFVAFRYLSGGIFYHTINKTSDGGLTWTSSMNAAKCYSGFRTVMALAPLASGKMLFACTSYDRTEFTFDTYNGTLWRPDQNTTTAGITKNTYKEISSDSDSSHSPYLAFVAKGNSSALKVARWNSDGTFNSTETADSTLSHSLPSITVTSDGIIHIYSLNASKVWETDKINSSWTAPHNPFGKTFTSPNYLTAGISYAGTLWEESSSTYNVRFGALTDSAQPVSTTSTNISPMNTDYYEGERRIVQIGANIFAFYHDGTSIVYKYSTDNGVSWSSAVTASTGTFATDTFRWTVATTLVNGVNHIDLFYYKSSGTTGTFYSENGNVTGTSISWNSPHTVFTATVSTSPSAAAVAATDTNNNVFAAFRYYTGSAFLHQIWKSTDGGINWTNATGSTTTNSGYRTVMAMTKLAAGKMLFAYTSYDHTDITYQIYNGTTWGSTQTLSGAFLHTNTFKEMSADSDSTNSAYIAYAANGTAKALKVARWNSDGTFNATETADSTLSHSLPSITITPDGIIHIYSLNSSKIWETDKINSYWAAPKNPFGTNFTSPNMLTAAISYPAAIWTENSTAPYNLMFGTNRISWTANTGILIPLYSYPFENLNVLSSYWNAVIQAKTSYPHVPIFAIINPNSGSCNNSPPCPNPDYQNGIGNLTKAGVVVIGYTFTSYGQRVSGPSSIATSVENDTSNYTKWYQPKGLNGIFLDEFNGTTGNENYYSTISNYVHNTNNLKYSFGNPGIDTSNTYLSQRTTDDLNTYEGANETYPFYNKLTNATLQGTTQNGGPWHTQYDKNAFSLLLFNETTIPSHNWVQGKSVYVGFMYLTNNTGCGTSPSHPTSDCAPFSTDPTHNCQAPNFAWCLNPWNTTSSYLKVLASYLNNVPVQSTIQSKDKSGNSLSIPIRIYQNGALVRNSTTPFTFNETSGWKFNFTSPTICKWTYGSVSSLTHSIIVGPNASITFTATNGTPPC
jgi:hypothetical protein